jgi:hypothetical protein
VRLKIKYWKIQWGGKESGGVVIKEGRKYRQKVGVKVDTIAWFIRHEQLEQ